VKRAFLNWLTVYVPVQSEAIFPRDDAALSVFQLTGNGRVYRNELNRKAEI